MCFGGKSVFLALNAAVGHGQRRFVAEHGAWLCSCVCALGVCVWVSEHLRRDFRTQMQSAIQHALVQGNAQVIDEAVNRLQHRCGVWF